MAKRGFAKHFSSGKTDSRAVNMHDFRNEDWLRADLYYV